MEKKITGLIGQVRKNGRGASKKASVAKLYKYLFIKIFASVSTLIIGFLTIAFSIIAPIVFFMVTSDVYSLINSVQYFILLLYCIFLFLFILMISIRLFANQIEDNTFLLVLTKPFTRASIIFTQYLVIIFSTLMLIVVVLAIQLILGNVLLALRSYSIGTFYDEMIGKLFIFLLIFCFLLISGVVFMASVFTSRTVFLVFSIFCSLFILGGLPYTLYTYKLDNLIFTFGPRNVTYDQLEKSIYYQKFLQEGLIKYPAFSKMLFDYFYTNSTYDAVKNYHHSDQILYRLQNFERLGIIKQTVPKLDMNNVSVVKWDTRQNIAQTKGEMVIQPINTFESRADLVESIKKGTDSKTIAFQKDLLDVYDEYVKYFVDDKGFNGFMKGQFTLASEMMYFKTNDADSDRTHDSEPPDGSSYYKFLDTDNKTKYIWFNNEELVQAHLDGSNFILDKNSSETFNNLFNNKMFYVVRSMEDSIYSIAETLKIVDNEILSPTDSQWMKYNSIMDQYSWMNKINIFEHFNKLWTWFLGYYGDFSFDHSITGMIDFNQQKNSFFSYPLYRFTNNENGQMNYKDASYVQNEYAVIIAYIVLGVLFIGATTVTWKFKKIS